MASLLRQLIAKPRAHHKASNLDLCYVTDNIIATSGPSGTYPQRAYRNPLDVLIKFLDSKHKDNWAIWEFRAEGTGYPDEAVYNRIYHYPWPDHHPPPFHLIPNMMASMRNWLKGAEGRVVVVHCKAGKGRSGTASCSYLVSEEGWKVQDAIDNFTEKRMKPGWGKGVSIPSQLRWLSYVDRWTNGGKLYVERKVEVTEIHVYGLRDGVKVAVRGFEDEGKTIKILHTFTTDERTMVRGEVKKLDFSDAVKEMLGKNNSNETLGSTAASAKGSKGTGTPKRSSSQEGKDRVTDTSSKLAVPQIDGNTESKPAAETLADEKAESKPSAPNSKAPSLQDVGNKIIENNKASAATAAAAADPTTGTSTSTSTPPKQPDEGEGADAIFRPEHPIPLETNDINVDCERRSGINFTSFALPTSVVHVWFNTFFEGNGPEQRGRADDSGVFEIEFDEMDGIKGSSKRGVKCFDRIAVVWKVRSVEGVVEEPKVGEEVKQAKPADWKGAQPVERVGEESETDEEGVKSHMKPK